MARKLYGPGARGGIVGDIQRALDAAGLDPHGIDEAYGDNTSSAVRAFQQARGFAVTGIVDEQTWNALMQKPMPSADVRCLELTAAFEGHGYTLAQGNWDGAWLTWGIIGFTLKYGEVQEIILNIQASAPQLIAQAFGDDAGTLLAVMKDSLRNQERWANSISVGSRLAEPWRTGFSMLGQFPQVRDEQRRIAHEQYFLPAIATARDLKLKTELGMALCFDIHVQNGGIGPAARTAINEALATQPPATEQDLRQIVADAVADAAVARFSEDVRERKMTIADGEGNVHGGHFVLENWGLSELPTPELT
jgi:hypothetical protein